MATKAEISALFKKNGRKVSAVGKVTKLAEGETVYGKFVSVREGKFGPLRKFEDLETGDAFVLPSHAALDLIEWQKGKKYAITCIGEQKNSEGQDFTAYDVIEAD